MESTRTGTVITALTLIDTSPTSETTVPSLRPEAMLKGLVSRNLTNLGFETGIANR